MLVVWECERLCVVFQFVPQAGLTWNILGFPPGSLVGHPSRCLLIPARHWLWRFYRRLIDWVVPGYWTGSVKATGLSYGKPWRIYWIAVRQWNFPWIRGIPRFFPNFGHHWDQCKSGETWKSVVGEGVISGTTWPTEVVHISKSAEFDKELFANLFRTVYPWHLAPIQEKPVQFQAVFLWTIAQRLKLDRFLLNWS